jgi:2-polyprenyl-3-methyl-5-hydroxy-6-metoxy-1,4-benzoquinol methylase
LTFDAAQLLDPRVRPQRNQPDRRVAGESGLFHGLGSERTESTRMSALPAVSTSGELSNVSWCAAGKIGRETLLQEIRQLCHFKPGKLLEVGAGRVRIEIPNFFEGTAQRRVRLDLEPATSPDVAASAFAMPFAPESFDTVLCMQMLEHVPTPLMALVEMHRVLRPGGRLIISAPQSWPLHMEPNDYFRYTRYGLEELLSRAGFTIEQTRSCGHFFAVIGVLLSHGALHLGLHAKHSRVRRFWRRRGIAWINHFFLTMERRWGRLSDGNVIDWAVLARRR